MSRRWNWAESARASSILWAGLVGFAVSCAILAEANGESAAPNVILFLADDQTWFDSGTYGNPDLPTPNIDRLAREGMRFDHAFTGTPMCAPTRQQLYTGLYPVRSGAYPNHSVVSDGTRSLVHHFQDLGYRVGLMGKRHFGPQESFPFEQIRSRGGPSSEGFDLKAAQKFIQRDPGQPYFLVIAADSPHTPWTQGDRSLFKAESIEVPGYLVDTPATREALVGYYAEVTHLDEQLGRVLALLDEDGEQNNTIVIYTSEQGASLPFAKWTLYDAGIRTAFIIRWPERIAKESKSDALVEYVDIVPTLVEAAGGQLSDVDGQSFLPVVLGQKAAHRDYVFGVQTTRGIIQGNDYPIRSVRSRRYKLILNLAAENGFNNMISQPPNNTILSSWETIDPDRARSYTERPAIEFYDLEADPWELHNLAGDPEVAEILAVHRVQLEEWMQSVGDRGLETELEALNHMNPVIVERIRKRFGEDALPHPQTSEHEP